MLAFPFLRSLDENQLCGLDEDGDGDYTAEGIIAITEMLKVNTTLQSIRCARGARFSDKASVAIDTNLVPDTARDTFLCVLLLATSLLPAL